MNIHFLDGLSSKKWVWAEIWRFNKISQDILSKDSVCSTFHSGFSIEFMNFLPRSAVKNIFFFLVRKRSSFSFEWYDFHINITIQAGLNFHCAQGMLLRIFHGSVTNIISGIVSTEETNSSLECTCDCWRELLYESVNIS